MPPFREGDGSYMECVPALAGRLVPQSWGFRFHHTGRRMRRPYPVSYTHLTLPTNREV